MSNVILLAVYDHTGHPTTISVDTETGVLSIKGITTTQLAALTGGANADALHGHAGGGVDPLTVGTLEVTGDSTLDGNAAVGGTLHVTGVTTLVNEVVNGTLHAVGNASLDANASIGGTLGVTGNVGFYGGSVVAQQGHIVDPTATAAACATSIALIIDALEAYGLLALS